MSNKNNSREQKAEWLKLRERTVPTSSATNSRTAFPFWRWNKRESKMTLTPARVGCKKLPFHVRVLQSLAGKNLTGETK